MTCCDMWNVLIVGFCGSLPSCVILLLNFDPFVCICVAHALTFNLVYFLLNSSLPV